MRSTTLVALLVIGLPVGGWGQSCPAGPTALVLSGGGAKGLAHIGVIRALDSLGIRPDLVVGTSMGAVIGAMYASGYTGKQIDSLSRALPLSQLFRTYAPQVPSSLGPLQPIIVWEQRPGSGLVFQRSSVLEPEVNALFNAGMLRGNLLARGDFDSLPIPFRAVATDLLSGTAVVLRSGDLARAVRASSAIPLLFDPERINGRYLGDGGLSANVPVAVARAAGATRLIVSYTTARRPDSLDLKSPLAVIDLLVGNLFRQSPDSLDKADVAIRPDVDGFRSLNFATSAVAALIDNGYQAAKVALGGVSCLPPTRPMRPGAFPAHVGRISIAGQRAGDSVYVARKLGLVPGAGLNLAELRGRLRGLGTLGRYDALWLYPTGSGDTVSFALTPRRSPRRVLGAGAVYDNDLGGKVWLGAVDRGVGSDAIETSATAFLGELGQEALFGFRWRSFLGQFVTPVLQVGGGRKLVRQFQNGDELRSLELHQAAVMLGAEHEWHGGWRGAADLEELLWSEPGRRGQHAAGVRLQMMKTGNSAEPLFHLDAAANGEYRRVELAGIATVTLGRLKLRPRIHYGIGESLPTQFGFPLGGDIDGFAGRHVGEDLSLQEASAGLVILRPMLGAVNLRIEPMVGAVGDATSLLPRGKAIAGIRAGLSLATSLGPIRVEYGVSEGKRNALLVRLGRWF
ncbi:MAG: patatin-like phospholipase family protein [Gemmatimonadota bacterium]